MPRIDTKKSADQIALQFKDSWDGSSASILRGLLSIYGRVRIYIIRNARIQIVGKYHSCTDSKLRSLCEYLSYLSDHSSEYEFQLGLAHMDEPRSDCSCQTTGVPRYVHRQTHSQYPHHSATCSNRRLWRHQLAETTKTGRCGSSLASSVGRIYIRRT